MEAGISDERCSHCIEKDQPHNRAAGLNSTYLTLSVDK